MSGILKGKRLHKIFRRQVDHLSQVDQANHHRGARKEALRGLDKKKFNFMYLYIFCLSVSYLLFSTLSIYSSIFLYNQCCNFINNDILAINQEMEKQNSNKGNKVLVTGVGMVSPLGASVA